MHTQVREAEKEDLVIANETGGRMATEIEAHFFRKRGLWLGWSMVRLDNPTEAISVSLTIQLNPCENSRNENMG